MWSFVYHPHRLPPGYDRWISSAAAVDPRLLDTLRRCRRRDFVYGSDKGRGALMELLAPMCALYGRPAAWADPAVSIPIPCELVHMGCGPSCEVHALRRLCRSLVWAMATYLPLNLLSLLLRKGVGRGVDRGAPSQCRALAQALRSASRSSVFLSSFVAMFWYGICLARTRVGPHVLGSSPGARQRIDGGLCVAAGCLLCGWSVLVESAERRRDIALFVAPKAAATLLPRRYAAGKQWRETLVFSASAAVVLTCARERPGRVRGVLGRVLGGILAL